MSDFTDAFRFLQAGAADSREVKEWSDWLSFRADSDSRQWVYLYRFTPRVFAWGTATGTGARLRNPCMFHDTLTGKYDRRVDYLMLRLIHAETGRRIPRAWVFNYLGRAADIERALMKHFGQSHCFRGFPAACCRRDISRSIHAAFRQTKHYGLQLKAEERRGFEEFMREVFFAEPARQNLKGVPFKFGDALEPKFLRDIGFEHLEGAVGAALDVKFPPAKATRKGSGGRARAATLRW